MPKEKSPGDLVSFLVVAILVSIVIGFGTLIALARESAEQATACRKACEPFQSRRMDDCYCMDAEHRWVKLEHEK